MSIRQPVKRPIIVKRRKEHHDEHGGQWKVAYADFITAMMAFFLVMWLLSTTTQEQRETIAKYFTGSSIFALPAGTGVLSGGSSAMDNVASEAERLKRRPSTNGAAPLPPTNQVERQRLNALKSELEQITRDGELKKLSDNIAVDITRAGLRVQIFDRDGEAMFATGQAQPTPRLTAILAVVAQVLDTVQNPVLLTGYTDDHPLHGGDYTNWELSADRANSVRRVLLADGLAEGRFLVVEGRAATDPLIPASPGDPRNRRIAVTVLRTAIAAAMRGDGQSDAAPEPSPTHE